jgi:replicative DNA helicase
MKAFIKGMDFLKEGKHDELVATMEESFRLNFDESLGLDYFEDLETRLERSKIVNEVVSTGLPSLDVLMGGGYRRKALFVYAGPGNVGKSLVLNDAASTVALKGYNVLYVSLELAEDYISQRTDAKFSGVSMNVINASPEEAIKKAILKRNVLRQEGHKIGKIIYKDYPPNTASCNDIRGLLKTLETKKNFKVDFIIIDYIKLLKANGKFLGDNLYNKLGTVCEEMRALAIEYNACVLSASQTGRQTYGSASVGMEDVSDSIAIPQTADVLVTLARNTTLNKEDSILLSMVKSRFSRNMGQMQAKIDYDYMKLVDINNSGSYTQSDNGIVPVAAQITRKPKPEQDDFNLQV